MDFKTTAKNIEAAANAHSNLCVLGAVIRTLEGGIGGYNEGVQKIIEISKLEQKKYLREYDRYVQLIANSKIRHVERAPFVLKEEPT